jgi:hypothetical protein
MEEFKENKKEKDACSASLVLYTDESGLTGADPSRPEIQPPTGSCSGCPRFVSCAKLVNGLLRKRITVDGLETTTGYDSLLRANTVTDSRTKTTTTAFVSGTRRRSTVTDPASGQTMHVRRRDVPVADGSEPAEEGIHRCTQKNAFHDRRISTPREESLHARIPDKFPLARGA